MRDFVYRWALVYVGKTKEYQVTESTFVDGKWINMAVTRWQTMESALAHISETNKERIRR